MSTDLYGIRVLKTQPKERKVTVKVFVVYYDTHYKSHQPLPKDHSFFFRILWDKGDTRFGKGGPIGDEVSVDQICEEAWVDNNTFRFIKNVEPLDTANFPLTDYTNYADFYYERDGQWEEEEKLIQATYEIEVTDSKYLTHLKEGMSWGTTCYETKAIQVNHHYLPQLPDMANPVVQLQPFEKLTELITDAIFSKDKLYLFVVGSSGILVAYQRKHWKEVWRVDTQVVGHPKIVCDNHRKLVWVQGETDKLKPVYDFSGKVVKENIFPNVKTSLNAGQLSPSGKYWVLPPYVVTKNISVFDVQGNFLWAPTDLEGEELRYAFFPNEEKLLVLVLSMELLKIFDLSTGKILTELACEALDCGYGLSMGPTGHFFSYNERNYIKRSLKMTSKIVELATLQTVLKYGPRYVSHNDYISQYIWSPDNELVTVLSKHLTAGQPSVVAVHAITNG